MSSDFCARLILPAALLLMPCASARAQSKFGVVDWERAIRDTVEIKKAAKDFDVKNSPRLQDRERLIKEMQAIEQNVKSNAGKLSQQGVAQYEAQFKSMQTRLQRIDEDLQADSQAEGEVAFRKAAERMQKVVTKLAEEKGLDMVVTKANVVYSKAAIELTAEAIAAYDKAFPVK